MKALIFQVAGRQGVGMLPVAGRPVVGRQIQWLRSIGCEQIVVEIDAHAESARLAEWLQNQDGIGAFAQIVLTAEPAGPAEVARRAGLRPGTPFLALAVGALGNGDLSCLYRHTDGGGAETELRPSPSLPAALRPAVVRLFGRGEGLPERVSGPGWGVQIDSMHDALAVGVAVLSGLGDGESGRSFGLPVHAAETRKGVWIARGASVSEEAELVGPVLIGAGAHVGAGARVGPFVCVGDRAVIEPNAIVEDAQVLDDCVVIEELPARHCVVSRQGLTSLGTGSLRVPFADAPVGSLHPASPTSAASRLLALLALLLLAPLAAPWLTLRALRGARVATPVREGLHGPMRGVSGFGLADWAIGWFDVLRGERTLIGVGDGQPPIGGAPAALIEQARGAPCGLIDVEAALGDPSMDPSAALRARAWYWSAKCARVDLRLLVRLIRLRVQRSAPRLPPLSPPPVSAHPHRL